MKVVSVKWSPVYEKWEPPCSGTMDYRHESDFVDTWPLFSSEEEARRYSQNNTGNYPYCTTGAVGKVKVTVEKL